MSDSDSSLLALQLFVTRGQKLLSKGSDFKFHIHARDGVKRKTTSSKKLLASIVTVIVVLLLFSGTFLASIQRVLCNPGHSKVPGSP